VLWALALLATAQQATTAEFPLRSKLRAGIVLGEPMSLTIATDLSEGLVLQLDLGLSASDRFSGIIGMDVVYRAETIFGRIAADFWLMPWFGFGMRGAIGEDDQPNRFGFRVPIGLSLLSETDPLELYAQVAAGLSAFPERRASVDAGAGIRVGF
jgi:hypothetical protein